MTLSNLSYVNFKSKHKKVANLDDDKISDFLQTLMI